ncbi:42034_t:CDS:2 [Gigaspora margarita]|uniref:42034_t:CDS:1 n=1 Tax=Gigaspora margarita TaxID=4874 RepID=A0ABM8W1T0_GIGMA|nr:42034_t:CDS:2 [Gigaspora margarita]
MEIESSTNTQPDILHEREDPEGLELDIYIGLHNGYPITQIDCSPKMKYVATLSEFDRSVALWSIYPNQPNHYETDIDGKLVMIDGIHFIASNVGERVLITSHVHDGPFTKWSLSYENYTFTLGVNHGYEYAHYVGKDEDLNPDANVSDKYWEETFNNPSLAGRFLPQPDFDKIIIAAYYGKILMEKLLILNKGLWIEKLFMNCIIKCPNKEDSYDLYSNIQFLSIITQFYSELIQKNHVIVYGFLSQMTFVVPSVEAKDNNVYLSSLSHLHHYDQSETEINQIKKGLEDLTSIKPMLEDLASIKNGLEDVTSVKKELEELTSIKEELKGLTSLFDNFKNEVMAELNKLQTS